ncbi:cytochrome-c peroxidase [Roseovarius aestuariivivens]|uniref:cytochrome-c peroxidase n=1 Tax=Roseovarius aestuariivivens TaxID=1888910 RepID=UPI00108131C9|nr:cytochrome c peroxidase [Roseovarius aestuariivivens]
MRRWAAAFGLWSLQATLSLAADLPDPANRVDFPIPGATSVLLGRDLFYDPILSGNRNIACGTCHNPRFGTSDGVALSLGEGAQGLGPARHVPVAGSAARLSRNTPALFNLSAGEFDRLFHDGRLARAPDARFGIAMPEGHRLERPVSLLAAQALLPLVAPHEMAGEAGENVIADAVAQGRIAGLDGAWQKLTERVADIPDYRRRFTWLIGPDEPLHITHIASALADFIAYEFRATDSPFDAFLAGQDEALRNEELRGMALFYGKAGCDACHAGAFQTDHRLHAIGVPPIGPGKGHGPRGLADHGLGHVTGRTKDRYRFRTPSLRNVALTAPYGHNGAYETLADMIRHHADPGAGLASHPAEGPAHPAMEDVDELLAVYAANTLPRAPLSELEVAALVAFLGALTDPVSREGRLGVPETVPSGLPVPGTGENGS